MNAHASPLTALPDLSLASVMALLAPHDEKALLIVYAGKTIRPGYHVTEVKAGSFVTLDCGGNPDAWQETILQVEDIAGEPGQGFMTVGKFRSILTQVERKIRLDHDARLTLEVGPPAHPMQVFDVSSIAIQADQAIMQLSPRPAICKPRHRAEASKTAACCGPEASSRNRA